MNLANQVREQERRVNLRPTEGQKKAQNYRMGHVRVQGLDISIENPKGSFRSGIDPATGKKWRSRLPNTYGYFKRTTGADGDHVDVFIGPHLASPHAFVIDQHDLRTGLHDEHKVMLGFASKAQARKAYIAAFSDGKGAKRIGHIEHMTIDAFKNWLRSGDTKKPIKRARGGRTGYAEGGAPAFDPTKPFEPVDAPAFDPTKPFTPADAPPDSGRLDAALRGVRAGATFNLGDEIEGARAAAPSWVPELAGIGPVMVPARAMVGAAKTGYGYLTGDKSLTDPYEKARDEARKNDEAAKTNHPYVYAGSELAGAVPAMAALPELGAARGLAPAARGIAKFGARTLDAAVAGGEYGALSGAGEGKDTADRAMNAATGLVSGILGGAGGNAVGEAAGALGTRYLSPAVNTVRGWFNHEGEAARRVAGGLKGDQDMIAQGTAEGLTWPEWLAARRRGEPVTLADLGAGRTQALLRSAKNTSPEASAQVEKTFNDRFHGQSERVADTVRNAIPGGEVNATKTADQIVAAYDAGRVPAYKQAFQQGDRPLMSPAMERLMGTDTFVGAMKRAISSGKDRDAVQGFGGFNPMVNVTEDGRIVFNKNAKGIPTYPNLQYWDQVKRELDSVATMGKRSGDNERADLAGQMAKILRAELDRQVPGYSNARGIAEQYFGESNALEAGRALAGKKVAPDQLAMIMRKMKPDERALFQEGYASDLANRVIGEMKDTTNITKGNGLMQSPNERKRMAAIFGPGGYHQIKARMYLETIMDGARQALGNSTTAKQLIEASLAGGAAGAIYGGGWDPTSIGTGMAIAGGAKAGTKYLGEEVKVGLKHMIGTVDAKTARRVAELLTSNDPQLLRAGYQMAAKSQAIMDGLQRLARRVALTGQTTARQPATEAVRALQGPMGARADDGRIYVSPNQDDQQKQQRP